MKEKTAKVKSRVTERAVGETGLGLRDDICMLLAGDIGGTKTLLGLFEPIPRRPRPIAVRTFTTLEYRDLPSMISAFANDDAVRGTSVERACFGVAGPVVGDVAPLTNVPWTVEARVVARAFDIPRVFLLNDLQAMACSVPVLEPDELYTLQDGVSRPGGNMALIAAGTGLGEASLHYVDGRFIPLPSEGGHADFAARTEREITLVRSLIQRYGRAEVEHVLSGPGLVNLHRITHVAGCPAFDDNAAVDAPAAISAAALERRCQGCIDALTMFVDAYGAEAGNVALRTMAMGGVFVGGGIAPKILPALADGRFVRTFRDKGPLSEMLEKIPVNVILNAESGLLGAAVYAAAS